MKMHSVVAATVVLGATLASLSVEAAGETILLVHKVVGVDKRGGERVLLKDRAGLLVNVKEVPLMINRLESYLVNSKAFDEIRVEISKTAFEFDRESGRVTRHTLGDGERVLKLRAPVSVASRVAVESVLN